MFSSVHLLLDFYLRMPALYCSKIHLLSK